MAKTPQDQVAALPAAGQIVRIRSRQYLVQEVIAPPKLAEATLVRMYCVDDDAQGEPLDVFWEAEIDAEIRQGTSWDTLAKRGFDDTRQFSAYLNALRWNCVTSTNDKLFQAPFRAGIEVLPYQLEPLRKALKLPRVNLFIADDVGLGKTIEAGLIVRELLMRQKVRTIVVACPPSVLLQWRDEMEQRFGLTFAIFDRNWIADKRRELGYSINPWNTHSRFLISHALLRDEHYTGPLRDWLGTFQKGSLLILDEAHNAAPASGARYAIDSQFTQVVRDIAHRFEHRLFLSATPHNGHSNSFSALLEILDPQRFCRGVPVKGVSHLEPVMVRRLKSDLRKIEKGFPRRDLVPHVIAGLPADAPELLLSHLLGEYRALREDRLKSARRSEQTASSLVLVSLQKRLLSSIEAFSRTLRVHREAIRRKGGLPSSNQLELLLETPGPDDERADQDESTIQNEEDAAIKAASGSDAGTKELQVLEKMIAIADRHRADADPRVKILIDWITTNPHRRVIIFTEYTDTKRYLMEQLRAIFPTERIAAFHGGMGEESREEVKRAFNADPASHPLRILIATDAAREGINLQNYCSDLFHFDLPWNPSRLEQRNGRIDRKLQREDVVRCHYFIFKQRAEDRVLEVLPQKAERILAELGSMSPILSRRIENVLSGGIRSERAEQTAKQLEEEQLVGQKTIEEEQDAEVRKRDEKLKGELDTLGKLLKDSKDHLAFDEEAFRDAISCGLELAKIGPLVERGQTWAFPAADRFPDNTWAATLDTLRTPRTKDEQFWEWRRKSPLRAVTFRDSGTLNGETVHLHLEQRVAQRLLGRFLAQGFVHDDLSRACLGHSKDAIPRVMILGRLGLYGDNAARLHEEIICVAARWSDLNARKGPLKPFGDKAEESAFSILQSVLVKTSTTKMSPSVNSRLLATLPHDLKDLTPHLESRARDAALEAEGQLRERAQKEAVEMEKILIDQRKRIEKEDRESHQLEIDFGEDEKKQIEANRKHWKRRLKEIELEIKEEPKRIREAYVIKARRVEPVGIVYLWPVTG